MSLPPLTRDVRSLFRQPLRDSFSAAITKDRKALVAGECLVARTHRRCRRERLPILQEKMAYGDGGKPASVLRRRNDRLHCAFERAGDGAPALGQELRISQAVHDELLNP